MKESAQYLEIFDIPFDNMKTFMGIIDDFYVGVSPEKLSNTVNQLVDES